MRLCNSRIPEEHLVCYQMSQRNWVIIKMLYRCLRWCLLSWHRTRLGFVTPIVGEVSLGPLGNTHHNMPCKQKTNELVMGWWITERVKRLAGNEIELGMVIPTIESRASNIPMTKGTTSIWASRFRYWLLTREVSRSCLHSSRTRRVRTLNVTMTVLLSFDVPKEFGVPDEIGDMTRSLEMIET